MSIAEQQQIIANLVTGGSEQRLGTTLLQLARKLGQKDPRSIRIEHKITHEELAEMVCTVAGGNIHELAKETFLCTRVEIIATENWT